MLRTELQTALNDVIVACEDVADAYENAASVVEDEAIAQTFLDIARARHAAAEELAEHLRALGDLPRAPDSDYETVRDALMRVKAALSAAELEALVEELRAADEGLEQTVMTALERPDLPARARDVLLQVQDDVRAAKERLARLPSG